MQKIFIHSVFVVFLFVGIIRVVAQITPSKVGHICLENTEQFLLASKYVENETYVIQVSLPRNYNSENRSYPVLYITDGEIAFEIIKGTADLLMLAREIKEIILVGISYGQGYDVWLKKRSRDLHPANDTVVDRSRDVGGAANFLKFIQFELFPEIKNKYRVNPDSIVIEGFSRGGLFNSYILFSQPGLFKGYIINAPPLVRNNKLIFRLETNITMNIRTWMQLFILDTDQKTQELATTLLLI